MKTSLFTSVILIALSISAQAAPKQLVCTDYDVVSQTAKAKGLYKKYSARGEGSKWKHYVETCQASSFAKIFTFTFDTDGLKNKEKSKAELDILRWCGARPYDVQRATFTSTPNIITFTWVHPTFRTASTFNVNRKTLNAGLDTDRNFQCKLRDVDTSANQI